MSDKKQYEVVTSLGRVNVRSLLYATDLRDALTKAYKLVPADWPGRPEQANSIIIQEVGVGADVD